MFESLCAFALWTFHGTILFFLNWSKINTMKYQDFTDVFQATWFFIYFFKPHIFLLKTHTHLIHDKWSIFPITIFQENEKKNSTEQCLFTQVLVRKTWRKIFAKFYASSFEFRWENKNNKQSIYRGPETPHSMKPPTSS